MCIIISYVRIRFMYTPTWNTGTSKFVHCRGVVHSSEVEVLECCNTRKVSCILSGGKISMVSLIWRVL